MSGDAVAMLTTRAPAKINLTLHVLGRRPDGYHELDSLVAFAGAADTLALEPGPILDLVVDGPNAGATGPTDDNLVIRAARHLGALRPGLALGRFRLTKRLPSAAGIGGGSSDAAAALRLLAELNGLPPGDERVVAAARATGADVPVCLDPRARTMRGIGERIGPPLPWTPLFCLLVNPRVAVPTPAVFRALGLEPGQAGPGEISSGTDESEPADIAGAIRTGRNDLEPPAISLAPAVADALARLRATPGCTLARMSGSGATVFGLYPDCRAAARAGRLLRADRPDWWIRPTLLR